MQPLGALIATIGKSVNAYLRLARRAGMGDERDDGGFQVRSSRFLELRTPNFGLWLQPSDFGLQHSNPRTSRPLWSGNDLSSVLDSLPPMAPSPQHSARKLSHRPSLFPAADPRFTFHASRFTVPLISILLALLCLAGTACGITTSTGKIIFDDPRGTVSLQTISDRSIQANHPINLEPALLAQLLKGIEIQDEDLGHNRVMAFRVLIAGP